MEELSKYILEQPIEIANMLITEPKDDIDIGKESEEILECIDHIKPLDIMSPFKSVQDDKNKLDIINDTQENLFELGNSMKIEETEFDVFIDEKHRIYRKYKLRQARAPKIKINVESEDIEEQLIPYRKKKMLKKETVDIKNEDLFKCKICSRIFLSHLSLICHMPIHSENKYTCSQCNEAFETNTELIEHTLTHTGKDQCFLCIKCKQAFSTELVYLRHTFNHIKKGPFKCPMCLVTSDIRVSIKRHLLVHFDVKETCTVCNAKVASRGMKSHMQKHSSRIKCVECGKKCLNMNFYNIHLRTHTGVKPFQCLYCGKGFFTSATRTVHTRIHLGDKRYKCSICHERFVQVTDCKKHESTHDKVKKYQCDICKKKLKCKEYLVIHMRNHNNYKPYKCPKCELSFTTGSHLNSHIRIKHVKVRAFMCTYCNQSFHTQTHMKRHTQSKRHLNNVFSLTVKEE